MALKGKNVKRKGYTASHIEGAYRIRCQKIKKEPRDIYIMHQTGNYETLASYKALITYKELKGREKAGKGGRTWKNVKEFEPIMDRFILDVDSEDLNKALEVTQEIMQELADYRDYINVYYSGKKGFHCEILTDELDIMDLTADKPGNSCPKYEEFLNYFHDKYNEVDTQLKDAGVRLIRKHGTKHELTGNYKILVDYNAKLDDILENSKKNKDMVEPTTQQLHKDKALLLLQTCSKPTEKTTTKPVKFEDIEYEAEHITTPKDNSIFSIVYNELNTNIHSKIGLIGAGLNGYVTETELMQIYQYLANTTDIEDSDNAEQSFIDAYRNDKAPCNLGQIRNHYTKYDLDLTNFDKLSMYLKDKEQSKSYDDFNNLLTIYEYDWFNLLEDKLYDYVDNTENIFNGIIHSVMALFGYGSRFGVVNAGSKVGKSKYIETIKKLLPTMKFKNLGSSTPASIRRKHEQAFNKKVVYLGDKGLKGKDDEEFKGLQEVFGGLITEGEFIRDVVDGTEVKEFKLVSDGVCVFYSEPYTNLRIFGAGDQYSTRSTFITVNPVKDGLSVFLQDENKTNPFYQIHRNYIQYILKHPLELKITNNVKTLLYKASKNDLRTAYYLLGLFKAYCQYMQIKEPVAEDVDKFLILFEPKSEITDIEYTIYKKLYDNLKVLTDEDTEYKITEDGGIADSDDMLLQMKNRKTKSFFTAKQIKTYFKKDFQNNQNLKDTIDQVSDILNNLYNANYLERLEWQYNNQNVYYILYNEDMEK